ncbi:hypothetical protein TRFO_22821 [Tritrichomonas foetus]|uniref:Uncharacterized protein n=1 Tax=Tritrichomonas foetus TaxID=1144522 RepID=A0A1J4KAW2_9EUKA|nr:hypothetical protein TRFO_22821 [Tritrichomonas foetus]|eukprot:OHT08567.1 hypothetical protein TRFO_22821 [Tritrichomonas foetus]
MALNSDPLYSASYEKNADSIQYKPEIFWKDFFDFLSICQILPKGIFTSNRDKISHVLSYCETQISKYGESKFQKTDVEYISKCLAILLHPQNYIEFRNYGFKFLILLFDKFKNYFYDLDLTKFAGIVFNLGLFKAMSPSVPDISGISVYKNEQPPNVKTEIEIIANFFRVVASENFFEIIWKFVQQYVIEKLYPDEMFEIDDLLETESSKKKESPTNFLLIHTIIFEFIQKVFKVPGALKNIFKEKGAAKAIFSVIEYASHQEVLRRNNDIQDFQSYSTFFGTIISTFSDNQEILKDLYKSDKDCFIQVIISSVYYLNSVFSLEESDCKIPNIDSSKISKLTEEISNHLNKFVILLFDIYELEDKKVLIHLFITCCHKHISNVKEECQLHIFTRLLTFFLINNITDNQLWDKIFTTIIEMKSKRALLLNCSAYFSAYVSILSLKEFLGIQLTNLNLQNNNQLNIYRDDKFWVQEIKELQELDKGNLDLFKKRTSDFIVPRILNKKLLSQIRLLNLILSNNIAINYLKSVFNSFKWEKATDDADNVQLDIYLICASFITPLLKITQVIGPFIPYNTKFLMVNFLGFLFQCTAPAVLNHEIKLHALNILGQIICTPCSIPSIRKNDLANWYLILIDCLGLDATQNSIKLTALTFACRSVFLCLPGSNVLIEVISKHFHWSESVDAAEASEIGKMDRLTPQEAASILPSINSLCEINQLNTVEIKNEIKSDIINKIKCLYPDLQVIPIMSILIEEVIAARKSKIDDLVNELFYALVNRDKKQISLENIYAIMPLTLILPDLEKVCTGSVVKIIEKALVYLSRKPLFEIENENDQIFERFFEFTVDLLIYGSMITDINKQYQEFKDKWENIENSSQRIQYSLMYLSIHYNRFPYPAMNYVDELISSDKNTFAVCGSSNDCILKVNQNQLSSLIPVGQFTWNFESQTPNVCQRELSTDINITDKLKPASDYKIQDDFTNKFLDVEKMLYTDEELLKEEFKVEKSLLCKPNEFDFGVEDFSLPIVNEFDFPSVQNLPLSSAGQPAAAFLSSLNYFSDYYSDDHLVPASSAPQLPSKLDFRHNISCMISQQGNLPHFQDFLHGLGLIDDNSKNKDQIIYADCRHKFIFRNNNDGTIIPCLIWNQGYSIDQYIDQNLNTLLRIEIEPQINGLFKVSINIIRGIQDLLPRRKFQTEILVTKKALPVVFLSQLLYHYHGIEYCLNQISYPSLKNEEWINNTRKNNDIFMNHQLQLGCVKNIFDKTNFTE